MISAQPQAIDPRCFRNRPLSNLEFGDTNTSSIKPTTTGWWFQPLWKIWKSVGMIIPNMWKNKTCSKPPTRLHLSRNQQWLYGLWIYEPNFVDNVFSTNLAKKDESPAADHHHRYPPENPARHRTQQAVRTCSAPGCGKVWQLDTTTWMELAYLPGR